VRILAISAHPDDETLGCGGTLLKHRKRGDDVFWMIATQAHEPQWSVEEVGRKAREVDSVARAFSVQELFRLGLPPGRVDTIPLTEIIEKMRGIIRATRPEIVYVVHGGDVHTDHQRVFAATASAIKPIYMTRFGVRRVLSFETLSSTEAAAPNAATLFAPTVFSDITPFIEQKISVMKLYESELQDEPGPRSLSAVRALARVRGGAIGVGYGEAFALMRELI